MAQGKTNFGLTFLALLSFIVAFFTARIFTTINPDTVVVSGGIHFHHFWYGLAMVATAGWLGISSNHPSLRRVYAVVFGFGGGLIGDEIGLLLTFGNYPIPAHVRVFHRTRLPRDPPDLARPLQN
jgi:hypothetical protein